MLPATRALTMSSREIAELTGKRHTDVRRDTRLMLGALEMDVSRFAHIYQDAQNRGQEEYLLPKDLTLTLVSGYNVRLRKRIIDRWIELEGARPDLSDPETLLQLLEQQTQARLKAERTLKDASEAVDDMTELVTEMEAEKESMEHLAQRLALASHAVTRMALRLAKDGPPQAKLLQELEIFMAETGFAKTRIGREVMNNSTFIDELRAGRGYHMKTYDRFQVYMANHRRQLDLID